MLDVVVEEEVIADLRGCLSQAWEARTESLVPGLDKPKQVGGP